MRNFILLAAAFVPVLNLRAYDFIGNAIRWPDGEVVMVLQLDDTRAPEQLSDGSASWNAVARRALAMWNTALPSIQFTPATAPGRADGNERNEAFFSDNVYGHRFGANVLAITTTWHIGDERVEGDTIFNAALPWDSYRGDLRSDTIDLQRVAVHEFGHTVGLDHPDQAKQVHPAIMNSLVSDLDWLAEDDIAGAQALYGTEARFDVDATVDPPDAGIVLMKPASPDGLASFGALSTLTPKPNKGFRFNYWDAPDPNNGRVLKLRVFENQSVTAHFTASTAPRIVAAPKSRFASRHDIVVFRVRVANAPHATFQWQFEGSDIPDATQPSLTLQDVDHAQSGLYSVIVRSAKGETQSKPARLVVDGY
jgi:hypothetical protein